MIPLKGSFVQSHRDSCSNSRILLMAKISHLIIDDVLFFPLRNVTSQTKYALGRHMRGEVPAAEMGVGARLCPDRATTSLSLYPKDTLTQAKRALPPPHQRWETGRPPSAMGQTSLGKSQVPGGERTVFSGGAEPSAVVAHAVTCPKPTSSYSFSV